MSDHNQSAKFSFEGVDALTASQDAFGARSGSGGLTPLPPDLWMIEARHRANKLLQLGRAASELNDRRTGTRKHWQAAYRRLTTAFDNISQNNGPACVAPLISDVVLSLTDLFGPLAGGLTTSLRVQPLRLDHLRRRALVLIASELTINALRHAYLGGGGVLDVCLEPVSGHEWALTVCDDGIGYPDEPVGGTGTFLVGELAGVLGSTVQITSSPSAGSRTDLYFRPPGRSHNTAHQRGGTTAMRYLVTLKPKPGATRADFEKHGLEEERRVWSLYSSDVIRAMYFQPEPIQVALVFEEAGQSAVDEHVRTFPMVKAGLFDVEIMHLGPWLPFQALFGPQARDGAAR